MMHSLSRREVATSAAILLLSVSSACGPQRTFGVGVREDPVGITYGSQTKESPEPRPPGSAISGFPSFLAPPIPTIGGVPTLAPQSFQDVRPIEACPQPGAGEAAQFEATGSVQSAPATGRYSFRREGSVTVGTGPATALSPGIFRDVMNVSEATLPGQDLPNFEFDVIQHEGDLRSSTSFRVDNSQVDGGLKIRQTDARRTGAPETFTPQPPLRIFRLSATPHAPQQEAGVDPLTGSYMSLTHQITGRVRVEGCGVVLDAWSVNIQGSISDGVSTQLNLTATLAVLTQYGGLVAVEDIVLSGVDEGIPYELRSRSTIDSPIPGKIP